MDQKGYGGLVLMDLSKGRYTYDVHKYRLIFKTPYVRLRPKCARHPHPPPHLFQQTMEQQSNSACERMKSKQKPMQWYH